MMKSNLTIFVVLLMISTGFAGCTSEEAEELQAFPQFSSLADDDQTYNKAKMAGSPFIVMFSAEWCNRPCYSTMHSMWNAQAELPVLVMSTDPAERAGGLTLEQWHESANAYDDDDNSTNNELTTYAFMKGDDVAILLEINTPGTMIFVNSNGEITDIHEGKLDDKDLILSYWANANR